jgi:hypothetical protein
MFVEHNALKYGDWRKAPHLTIHVHSINGPSIVTCMVSTLYPTQSNNNNNNNNKDEKKYITSTGNLEIYNYVYNAPPARWNRLVICKEDKADEACYKLKRHTEQR